MPGSAYATSGLFFKHHAFQVLRVEAEKLAGRQIFRHQNGGALSECGGLLQLRPGNVKKLLADVANIADAFTQVIAGGE